ncbi:hypothetical protein PYW07_006296 [Mythimna separata]|uniref:Uncharacterized protein n=1 Tax=Mythimna separata TaxID=271217 RepID=A0AAD8DWE6_MYTSE|nr:hypothetical protein PYW07_006296 [Mythimna separata]
MQGIQDRLTPVSSVVDLQVDWTTGLLKDLEGNTASALLLADAPTSPNHQMTDVPVAVLPTIKPMVKLINEAIKGKDSNELDENLARWLGVQSDEEEDMDLDVHTEFDSKLTPAHIMDECDEETQAFVLAEDKSSDQLLAELLPKDHLTFDWSHDRQTFTGTRETFIGQAGPTFTTRPTELPVVIEHVEIVQEDMAMESRNISPIPGTSQNDAIPATFTIPAPHTPLQSAIPPRSRRRRSSIRRSLDTDLEQMTRIEARRVEAELITAQAFAQLSEHFSNITIALTSIANAISDVARKMPNP